MTSKRSENLTLKDFLDPATWGNYLSRIVLIIFMLGASIAFINYGSYIYDRSTIVVHDNIWFRKKIERIKALDKDIIAAKDALKRQVKEDDKRLIRFLGGGETANLNKTILALELARAETIREYNIGRERTNPETTPTMPPYLMYSDVENKTVVCDESWTKSRKKKIAEISDEIDSVEDQITVTENSIKTQNRITKMFSTLSEKLEELKGRRKTLIKNRDALSGELKKSELGNIDKRPTAVKGVK